MRLTICMLASVLLSCVSRAQTGGGVPVFQITPVVSSVKFDVEASVAIKGKFDKWDASLTFKSPDVSTGVLDIKIQADSVDTGSGVKNGKLKGKDFFDVKQNPYITFHSTKIVQTGSDSFEVDGDSPSAAYLRPKSSPLKWKDPARVPARLAVRWPSIGSNTG
jgi:polyisoprenoid-binding protein YceI